MNRLGAHGPTRVLTGLLITAILSMAVVASPAAAESDTGNLYDDGSALPLSDHGAALLGFLGPLPSGLAANDLAKALLASDSSTERNPFGLLVRFTESATAAEVAEVPLAAPQQHLEHARTRTPCGNAQCRLVLRVALQNRAARRVVVEEHTKELHVTPPCGDNERRVAAVRGLRADVHA